MANIRTIAGLAKEGQFVEQYEQQLEAPYAAAKKKARVYGICFAFAQCVIFMAYAASFRYGGYLVSNEGLPYLIVFRLVNYVTMYYVIQIFYYDFIIISWSVLSPVSAQKKPFYIE